MTDSNLITEKTLTVKARIAMRAKITILNTGAYSLRLVKTLDSSVFSDSTKI